ncbi:hypothetical protein BAV1014 [Bordetella avium 197N]|uniref:Uncharacterized protein n=1 Tax=Bordetella avium (strain 197N) TaxID=360910 RepID=Q2KV90_BORA1|nr:hypothetical protein BAV1014 [Bordetella avium 197N]
MAGEASQTQHSGLMMKLGGGVFFVLLAGKDARQAHRSLVQEPSGGAQTEQPGIRVKAALSGLARKAVVQTAATQRPRSAAHPNHSIRRN